MRPKEKNGISGWYSILTSRLNWLSFNGSRIDSRRMGGGSAEAYEILRNHHIKITRTIEAFHTLACPVDCSGVCCHFPPGEISVQIEAALAAPIREHLIRCNLKPEDYIQKVLWSLMPVNVVSALPKELFVFRENADEMVWQVKATGAKMPHKSGDSIPRTCDGHELWVDSKSRACAFLDSRSLCMLQEANLKPAACRDFVCVAYAVHSVTKQLGYLSEDDLKGLGFAERNRLASNLMEAFVSDELMRLETEYHDSIVRLTDAYLLDENMDSTRRDFKAQEEKYILRRRRLFRRVIDPGPLDYLAQLLSWRR